MHAMAVVALQFMMGVTLVLAPFLAVVSDLKREEPMESSGEKL